MIYHIFNSSLISGPETLVMPAIATLAPEVTVVLLRESRIPTQKQSHVEEYMKGLGLPFLVVEVHARFDRQAIQALKYLLKEAGASLEVAHAHDVKASFYLFMACRNWNQPFSLVSTHHGVDGRTGVVNRLYELFYSYVILPQYDLVLTVCTQDRTSLLHRGLKKELVQVHLNGVTRTMIQPENRQCHRTEIHKAWGLASSFPKEVCVIGVAARLEEEKRPFEILEMLRIMTQLKPAFEFVVLFFGRGSLEEKLQEKSKEFLLEKNVRWMGYRAGLGNEFAGFDVLLSLSRAEGLPINLLEAGWAGTPVFATAVHGVNDLISSPKLGVLVAVNENTSVMARKLLEFAENRTEMQQKGQAFQSHVLSNFSQEVWLNNLTKFYKDLREKKSRSASHDVT
jgi:glycosyltransferase EpsD